MITALAIIPLICVAGVAIDAQITVTRKSKVQAIVDSAVIAGSKSMQSGKSQQKSRPK